VRRFALVLVLAGCASSAAVEKPPEQRPVVIVESIHCYILQRVGFEKDSPRVPPDSMPVVEMLARVMHDDPGQFVFVELAGHASSDEPDAVSLSRHRAQAVRDAIVALGVDGSRIRVRGYGAHCTMLDDPNDAESVYKDRRVEMKVIRSKQGETGVEIGCEAARTAGIE
jgi:outer membrane protein OmpA-like peptidoglycan-associated protein